MTQRNTIWNKIIQDIKKKNGPMDTIEVSRLEKGPIYSLVTRWEKSMMAQGSKK